MVIRNSQSYRLRRVPIPRTAITHPLNFKAPLPVPFLFPYFFASSLRYLFLPSTRAAGASPLMKNFSKAPRTVWRCAATAASNSRPKSLYLPTRMLPIFGPSASIPRARSTPPAARLRKCFASIRTANLPSSSILLTSPLKPWPLTPKVLFM